MSKLVFPVTQHSTRMRQLTELSTLHLWSRCVRQYFFFRKQIDLLLNTTHGHASARVLIWAANAIQKDQPP